MACHCSVGAVGRVCPVRDRVRRRHCDDVGASAFSGDAPGPGVKRLHHRRPDLRAGLEVPAAADRKETYLASLQFLFEVNNLANLAARVACGIYTLDLIPLSVVGILGGTLGRMGGIKVLGRININMMKKLVYGYVGLSGMMILAEHLL